MAAAIPLVLFNLESQSYALHLDAVERVVHAVEVTVLPGSPHIVLGVINAEGSVVPVVNARRRFNLPERGIEPADMFIITRAGAHRLLALVADQVSGVIEVPASEVLSPDRIAGGLKHLDGVAGIAGGIVLIHDPGTFLTASEETALDKVLEDGGP